MTRRRPPGRWGALAILAIVALVPAGPAGVEAGLPSLSKGSDLLKKVAGKSAAVDSARVRLDQTNRFLSAFEEITPMQEYYLGRAVSASILTSQPLRDRPEGLAYLNLIGTAVSLASSRPELYAGYRFTVLDSPELNALASPDGTVFMTHGLLALCQNEDEIAAVLAHEIAHIQARHGIKSLSQEQKIEAGRTIATELGAGGSGDLARLSGALNSSAAGISRTLLTQGYNRGQEEEADAAALKILAAAGYDPAALPALLESVARHWDAHGPAFMRSHDNPQDRIRKVRDLLAGQPATTREPARDDRFRSFADRL